MAKDVNMYQWPIALKTDTHQLVLLEQDKEKYNAKYKLYLEGGRTVEILVTFKFVKVSDGWTTKSSVYGFDIQFIGTTAVKLPVSELVEIFKATI